MTVDLLLPDTRGDTNPTRVDASPLAASEVIGVRVVDQRVAVVVAAVDDLGGTGIDRGVRYGLGPKGRLTRDTCQGPNSRHGQD